MSLSKHSSRTKNIAEKRCTVEEIEKLRNEIRALTEHKGTMMRKMKLDCESFVQWKTQWEEDETKMRENEEKLAVDARK